MTAADLLFPKVPASRVVVCAEIGPNHGGSLQNLFTLIDAARDAGANVVKFQAYTADELVALRGDGQAPEPWGSEGWSMRDLYEQAATPLDWFPTIKNYCEALGVPWFASVFGEESLAALEAVGCPVYKIAAMESGSCELLEMVAATGKPRAISSPDPEAERPAGTLMCYCPPGYPQSALHLRNLAHGYQGFSYHNNNPHLPALAVPFGIRYIEAHIHLETEPSRFEAGFAMTPPVFAQMVEAIRQAEAACAV